MGDVGGGWLERPRQWWSASGPAGKKQPAVGCRGQRKGIARPRAISTFNRAAAPARRSALLCTHLARVRVRFRIRARVGVRVTVRVRVRVRVRARARARVRDRVVVGV